MSLNQNQKLEKHEASQIQKDFDNIDSIIQNAGFKLNFDGIGMFLDAQKESRYVIPCMSKYTERYPDLMKYYYSKAYTDTYKCFPISEFMKDIAKYAVTAGAINDARMMGRIRIGNSTYDNPNNLLSK